MAKRRKKTRTHLKGAGSGNADDGAAGKSSGPGAAPKSFVMRSGNVGRSVGRLVQDVRRTMEPNTATRLRERKSNKLRDFLTMCGPLGVSHLIMFGQKQKAHLGSGANGATGAGSLGNVNLRIARTPRGPTVTFRVNKFALASDVAKAQRRARAPGGEFQTAPLLVLNNFGSAEKHVKLLVSVFQGLFPPIQVQTMHLSSARRIVLLNYHEATGTIDWRHYLISVRPVGVSRRVRKVVEGSSAASRSSKLARSLPDLGKASDIADYLLGSANGEALDGFETDASSASEAESDVEDGVGGGSSSKVTLPSRYVGRGNASGQQRAVRLRELGPRMELRCVKIEEGIPGAAKAGGSGGGNEVLWHDYVQKSGKEGQRLRKEALEKEKVRKQRREEQEENVRRKKEASGKGKAKAAAAEQNGAEAADEALSEEGEEEDEEEDEFAYEDAHGPGAAPDGDLFDDEDDGVGDEFDDEASMNEDEEEEEEEEDEEEGDEDDSDLTPFEIDEDEDDDEDFSEEEEVQAPPKKKTHRR